MKKYNGVTFIEKSLFSGFAIGLAQLLSISISLFTGSKILSAFAFSLGLISILYYNTYLYTGKVGYADSKEDIWALPIMFIANLIGCIFFTIFSPVRPQMTPPAILAAAPLHLFLGAFICGIFIYEATYLWKTAKHPYITTIICVMGFILCGGRHCIADWAAICLYTNNITLKMIGKIIIVAIGNGCGSIIANDYHQANILEGE